MPGQINSEIYGLLPTGVEGIDQLVSLALDMRWSWNHETDHLWKQLHPELWQRTRNPWLVLQTVSKNRIEQLLEDKTFFEKLSEINANRHASLSKPGWFQQNHPGSALSCVAYFSMEYMLSEALPIYVGGLGNVAGDQLKSASDLGLPVVAVGLLYNQGYFRQQLDNNGHQQAFFPFNDPGQLPITPLRLDDGQWLRFSLVLPGGTVWLRTWQVQVGKLKLYLLDTNDACNPPLYRNITNQLYGGGPETRICQEIVLGIGGWRLLTHLGLTPEVVHMNEGHAGFVVLERASAYMKKTGISFPQALTVTRTGNIFTTHTSVAAGFDHFESALMQRYFKSYAEKELNISFHDLMALGRLFPANASENFNMAYLAIRGSGAVNAVSAIHRKVSRQIFQCLFPRWPAGEVPVGAVTNGVHAPSWDSRYADEVWTAACGKDRWRGALELLPSAINNVPDDRLWRMRNDARAALVDYIRQRLKTESVLSGGPASNEATERLLDPNILTLGFARRFVGYKRPTLLLNDELRLIRLLTDISKPLQVVIAGKAPPYDEEAKGLIAQWTQFIRRYQLHNKVVFISDHDMMLTEYMVQGVDVWLNTPRRPWEACGTSGMKTLVNGGLNLSELDGWWAEAFHPDMGWAMGDGAEHFDDPFWDAREADQLYTILEQQVIPLFYERNDKTIPEEWVKKIRCSMANLTPKFSANRSVREYAETYYLPAAERYRLLAADDNKKGMMLYNAQHSLKSRWNEIRIISVSVDRFKEGYKFGAAICLNGIDPAIISVEIYAEAVHGLKTEKILMTITAVNEDGSHYYTAVINTERPAGDYTVRMTASTSVFNVPLECNLILWQR